MLNAIPFITEFTLACGNGEKPVLFADIEGELVPVVQSADGAKYQVSWVRDIKKAQTGEHKVDLYDSDGYVAVRRARDRGDAATTAPLVSIIVSYPGSYGREKIIISDLIHLNIPPSFSFQAVPG